MNGKCAALFLAAAMIALFAACGGAEKGAAEPEHSVKSESVKADGAKPDKGIVTLKFEDIDYTARNYEQYDGTQVRIRGYMSSLSPLDGKFIYLMNIPYQNCPFCQPSTADIVNTVAAYASGGKRIDFYDGPIEVTGTVEVGDTQDEFGYFYPFKLVGASYVKLDTEQMSENAKMYGALAEDGVIDEIMLMINQIHVNAYFETYDDMTLDDVSVIADGDFDRVIKKITAVDKSAYADLTAILDELKAYNSRINEHLEAEAYAENTTAEMSDQYYALVDRLYAWLNKFEI